MEKLALIAAIILAVSPARIKAAPGRVAARFPTLPAGAFWRSKAVGQPSGR